MLKVKSGDMTIHWDKEFQGFRIFNKKYDYNHWINEKEMESLIVCLGKLFKPLRKKNGKNCSK